MWTMDTASGMRFIVLLVATFVSAAFDQRCPEPTLLQNVFASKLSLLHSTTREVRDTFDEPTNKWQIFRASPTVYQLQMRRAHTFTRIHLQTSSIAAFNIEYSVSGREWRTLYANTTVPMLLRAPSDTAVSLTAQIVRLVPVALTEDETFVLVDIYGCQSVSAAHRFVSGSYHSLAVGDAGHALHSSHSDVSLAVRTVNTNAVLLAATGTDRHFLLIQLENSLLTAYFLLGSTVHMLGSQAIVNDGDWHNIRWLHSQDSVQLFVDNQLHNSTRLSTVKQWNIDHMITIGAGISEQRTVYPLRHIMVADNFTGCLGEAMINGEVNVLEHSLSNSGTAQALRRHVTAVNEAFCYDIRLDRNCVTLEHENSFIEKRGLPTSAAGAGPIEYELQVLTASANARLFTLHGNNGSQLILGTNSSGHLSFAWRGVSPVLDSLTRTGLGAVPMPLLADMRWHVLLLRVHKQQLQVELDGQPALTLKSWLISTDLLPPSGTVRLGPDTLGCVRLMQVNGADVVFLPKDAHKNVHFDRCTIQQNCYPNPCQHGGQCLPVSTNQWQCDCAAGYSGKHCQIVDLPHSCAAYFELNPAKTDDASVRLDLDGPGPLEPVTVHCSRAGNTVDGTVLTYIHHADERQLVVSGQSAAGSYHIPLTYSVPPAHTHALATSARSCWQPVSIQCHNAASLIQTVIGHAQGASVNPVDMSFSAKADILHNATYKMSSWWIGRTGQPVYSWASGSGGQRACECGLRANCVNELSMCNCDGSSGDVQQDFANLTDINQLPVQHVLMGDTDEDKHFRLNVGPFICAEMVADEAVTKVAAEANMIVKRTSFLSDGSLHVQIDFRTTRSEGVLFEVLAADESLVQTEHLSVFYYDGYRLRARIIAAGQLYEININARLNRFNDDAWHTVAVGIGGQWATLHADRQHTNELKLAVAPALGGKVVIGGDSNTWAGYIGALRRVYVDGQPTELAAFAADHPDMIKLGVQHSCTPSACQNGGVCVELYDTYECDCSATPFTGARCEHDVGLGFAGNATVFVRTEVDGSEFGDASNGQRQLVRLGWHWQVSNPPPADDIQLLEARNALLHLTIALSAETDDSGELNVRASLFDGSAPAVSLQQKLGSFDEYHELRVMRDAKQLTLHVDNAAALSASFTKEVYTDWVFTDWHVGAVGFTGCISRVVLDERSWPFKQYLLATEPQPDGIEIRGVDQLYQDWCPLDAVVDPSLPELDVATALLDSIDDWLIYDVLANQHSAAEWRQDQPAGRTPGVLVVRMLDGERFGFDKLTGLLGIVCALVACILFCLLYSCWHKNSPSGEYKTHEGDPMYQTPDHSETALMPPANNRHSFPLPPDDGDERREFFI